MNRYFSARRGETRREVTAEEFQRQRAAPARGLGDLVEIAAKPIAKALRMDCLDPQTGELKPESGCAKRKRWLNNPFK